MLQQCRSDIRRTTNNIRFFSTTKAGFLNIWNAHKSGSTSWCENYIGIRPKIVLDSAREKSSEEHHSEMRGMQATSRKDNAASGNTRLSIESDELDFAGPLFVKTDSGCNKDSKKVYTLLLTCTTNCL